MSLALDITWSRPDFQLQVDCEFPGRGITALFGRSGSGKTTVLRCIAGLERAARALVRFNGDVWQDDRQFVPTHRRPLGYVFQESSLFPHLAVRGNLEYGLHRVPAEDRVKDFLTVFIAQHNRTPPEHWNGVIPLLTK